MMGLMFRAYCMMDLMFRPYCMMGLMFILYCTMGLMFRLYCMVRMTFRFYINGVYVKVIWKFNIISIPLGQTLSCGNNANNICLMSTSFCLPLLQRRRSVLM